MSVRVNRNRRIGRVIFFVEGDKDEPSLLTSLFSDALGYELIRLDKRSDEVIALRRDKDRYSKVYVIPMPSSSIAGIPASEEFLDETYAKLKEYGLQYDESRIYYLFDRDRQSNKQPAVENAIARLRNPLDNGIEMAGALILSYPCLQSYYLECEGTSMTFSSSKEAKKHANTSCSRLIDDSKVKTGFDTMIRTLASLMDKPFDESWVDDYSLINGEVYAAEENAFSKNNCYVSLSLLSLALLDLGILEFEN